MKRNLNNGMVVLPKWKWCLLRCQRFLWLVPVVVGGGGAAFGAWHILPAIVQFDGTATLLWFWVIISGALYSWTGAERFLRS